MCLTHRSLVSKRSVQTLNPSTPLFLFLGLGLRVWGPQEEGRRRWHDSVVPSLFCSLRALAGGLGSSLLATSPPRNQLQRPLPAPTRLPEPSTVSKRSIAEPGSVGKEEDGSQRGFEDTPRVACRARQTAPEPWEEAARGQSPNGAGIKYSSLKHNM